MSICLLTILVFVGNYIVYSACEVHRHRHHVSHLNKLVSLPQKEFWRLPNDTKPLLYDLYLFPDLSSGLYDGFVNITIKVNGNKNDIVLHSKDLVILNIGLTNSHFKSFHILNIREISKFQVIVITTREEIVPGIYYLFIKFKGTLGNRIGFYRSNYKAYGEIRQIATTKFEPTYARQAFPCFDEPNLKAKYKVHLVKPKNTSYIALSNYPVASTSDYDKDHELVSFEETVSMSTYLSCFIVSDFTHTETFFMNDGKNISLKVYASPENLDKTRYAGEIAKKVIEYYIDYFQIPYPLPKLDMVAIPDFVSGAMEHWGIVTFRETALLYTNTTHSSANKQGVAKTVAHELAHSWFGNLVTMDWWQDLWLNEGFATYIEYKGVLAVEPTWGMMEQLINEDILDFDSTLSSHPILQAVLTPDQITAIFDSISYSKGAALLRMLENTVHEKKFEEAVKNYLNLYAYKNAITKDFLVEIQRVVGNVVNVEEMMETYTIQMGYPILIVTTSGDNFRLSQKRFLKNPDASYDETDSKYRYRWSVPVTYVTDLGKSSNFTIFKYNDSTITITKPVGAKWIKFNYDQVGYYRVNYPVSEWENLINYYNELSTADRTHLIEEAFSIAEAYQLSYTIPLSLTKKLLGEMDYTPWKIAASKLMRILRFLRESNSAQESAFKRYVINIITPAYNYLTWIENADDTHLTRLTRLEVLKLACAVDHEMCLAEAQIKFNNWVKTRQALSPDLRELVYSFGIENATAATWNDLLEIYKTENDAAEKLKLFKGLASIRNTYILKNLLKLSENEKLVRSQDFFTALGYISENPIGTQIVWDWIRSNWDYLVDRFALNDRYLGSLIPTITSRFVTPARLSEMKRFFKDNPKAGAGLANRAKALETVQNNIIWLSKYKTTIEEWIINNSIQTGNIEYENVQLNQYSKTDSVFIKIRKN